MRITRVKFWTEQGSKAPDDRRVHIRTLDSINGEVLKMEHLLDGSLHIAANEDYLMQFRPHWFRGGDKLLDYLRDGRRLQKSRPDLSIEEIIRITNGQHKLVQTSFGWPADGGESESDD